MSAVPSSSSRTLALALGLVVAVGLADDARAANWHIQVKKEGPTSARLTFDAEVGQQYMVCWKPDSAAGDVCGYNGKTTQVNIWGSGLTNIDYVGGRKTITLHSLATCGIDYKVRIRRTFVALDTYVFRFPC